ncbi:MAG: 30S ribosomal protein S20, partial [Candidatus Pelagibacterales bacterium]
LESKKIKEAKSFLPKFHSQLMKVVKTGVISKKTASRKISKITKKINKSEKK